MSLLLLFNFPPTFSVRFRMLARDVNSNPTQYRSWIAYNTPDLNAQAYTGYKSGKNPFIEISAYEILDPGVIADFSLPVPTSWEQIDNLLNVPFPARKVLPYPVEDSQLCILDGYAYMFGGKNTNKIWRASLNNPADWVDTGAVLPTNLFDSSLAVVNNTIYLFGGNDGYINSKGRGTIDNIYSAPVSNPLQWSIVGHLPRPLQNSCFGMTNGQLYLFGGKEINEASAVILTASASNPLSWTDTGARLPTAVYSAMFGQVNGNFMIFGGQLLPDTPTNLIWSANTSNPTSWAVSGALPYPIADGQFINIGGDGYIFAPATGAHTTYTPILQSNLQVNPNLWYDTQQVVPGVISHAQMAVIYDRIWLFGGSGSTAMFACNQTLKYSFTAPKVVNYANISRTVLQSTNNANNPLQALSIPWWITDYPFFGRP